MEMEFQEGLVVSTASPSVCLDKDMKNLFQPLRNLKFAPHEKENLNVQNVVSAHTCLSVGTKHRT